MKRLIAVLSGLLVLPAFAEVAPAYYYEDAVEYSDADYATDDVADVADATQSDDELPANTPVAPAASAVAARNTTTRSASSRAVPATTSRTAPGRANTTTGRAVAARTATTTANATSSRASTSRAVRSATTARSGTTANTNKTVSARRNVPTTGATAARASIIQSDTVNTPLYTGRVGVRTAGVSARSSGVRVASSSVSTTSVSDTATVSAASTTSAMDELAQLTDFCKAQYQSCMDNFCNVLDDNQGRCSCSKNIKNYEKTETALKQATEELQNVAQKIQYIGLSSDEIDTLFTQTEAELQMSKSSDSSQLKTDLDKIKNMIVSVKSGTATSTADSGISMDLSGLLDFSVSSAGFDLSAFLGNSSSDTSSISNQRGEQLYKTAAARCKASVLNSCTAQGVDASVITNSYDLEIDKQCLIYERNLTESNDQMSATVRNAKSVLQKARLLVAQQKNSYDLRGCINALDSCMQDDFVCGSDYENCLDPSGKYIVNGAIVQGSTPGESGDLTGNLYATWSYGTNNSAWGLTNVEAVDWADVNAAIKAVSSTVAKSDVNKPDVKKLKNAIVLAGAATSGDSAAAQRSRDVAVTALAGVGITFSTSNNQAAVIRKVGSALALQTTNYTTPTGSLMAYIDDTVTATPVKNTSANMSEYLQYKIGYHDDASGKNYGMCMSVLNKCQDSTYTGSGQNIKYNPANNVIKEYLSRTLTQLKAQQDTILANYAESCVSDVTSCLNSNNYNASATDSTKNALAIKACNAVISTCMSVNGITPDASGVVTMSQTEWIKYITAK